MDRTPTGRYADNVVPATRQELLALVPLITAKPVTSITDLFARMDAARTDQTSVGEHFEERTHE